MLRLLNTVFSIGLLAEGVLAVSSCRQAVFEVRDECPATLVFRASPPLDGLDTRVQFALRLDGILHTATSVSAPALNSGLVFECERGNSYLSATAYYGWPDNQDWVFGGVLRIPEGSMCPKAGAAFLEAPFPMASEERTPFLLSFSELYYETLVRFEGGSLPEKVLFEAEGNTDGFVIPAVTPHRGTFTFSEEVPTGEPFLMRIPRFGEWGTAVYRVTGGGREWRCDVAKAIREAGEGSGSGPVELTCRL